MNKIKFIILTGPIRSGKTTLLLEIFGFRENCGGFLTPDLNGKRFFYKLDEKKYFPFEIEDQVQKKTLNIGRYNFDMQIFDIGNSMMKLAAKKKYQYFVIDEIGKLELANKGFASGLRKMLSSLKSYSEMVVILVIRNYLLKDITTKYGMNDFLVLDVTDPGCRSKLETIINS